MHIAASGRVLIPDSRPSVQLGSERNRNQLVAGRERGREIHEPRVHNAGRGLPGKGPRPEGARVQRPPQALTLKSAAEGLGV
jgi:hypothetical protein